MSKLYQFGTAALSLALMPEWADPGVRGSGETDRAGADDDYMVLQGLHGGSFI